MYFTKKKIDEIRVQIEQMEKTYKTKRGTNDKLDPLQKAEKVAVKTTKTHFATKMGERLKTLREAKQISQKDMTELFYPLAPMSISGYCRIETGEHEPSLALLVMIADVWNVDLHWLLTGETREKATLPVEVQAAMDTIAAYCQNSKCD